VLAATMTHMSSLPAVRRGPGGAHVDAPVFRAAPPPRSRVGAPLPRQVLIAHT